MVPIVAAAGYSLIYLLCGGGLGGAILYYFICGEAARALIEGTRREAAFQIQVGLVVPNQP